MLGKEYSQNEIIIGLIGIISIYYISQYINISLFQMLMIIITCGSIYIISTNKKIEINTLQLDNNISETNNKKLLKFLDSISYFNMYNPTIYSKFITKIKNYINLTYFINQHQTNNYKLYSKKILTENLLSQKKDILETFLSFEHTLDDRITSTYKLVELSKDLNKILIREDLSSF
jgi:hypothetical protein